MITGKTVKRIPRKSIRNSTKNTTRKSTKNTTRKTGSGTSKKITLQNKKMQLYVGSKLQSSKLAWVAVSDGYIYISRDKNRSYWVLRKMKPQDRPKITFNDKKKTLRIGSNKIVVNSEKDYELVKLLLKPYTVN